ncbi:uncharacterized protein LOC119392844 [Rhipicephalus sanguineus]|uniref:uncharacterized protein LOC119392844 n=1 Tax=Rhipicephalus sanguineus TaxID=34632 RepID=UPI001895ED7D|nr:uncharacterized protein LOC119392844 [Rhipicephalus sanguineus]
MAEAPGDKKGQDASKKSKKKRRRNSRKNSRKEEPRKDTQTQKSTNAGVVPKGKEKAKVGRAECLPNAGVIANSDDSAKLTKFRPSLLELREAFRKTAPKHQIDSASRKASDTSTMASGQSQTTSVGPSTPGKRSEATSPGKSRDLSQDWRLLVTIGHHNTGGFQVPQSGLVSVSKESSGARSILRTLRNVMSGQWLAYCVVALVVLALVVLVVILTAILSRMHAKKREVSSSVTAITSPPRHVKGAVDVDLRERTTLMVP